MRLWYTYEALDSKAKKVKDVILADDSSDAISKIRAKGLYPTRVKMIDEQEVKRDSELLACWKANREHKVPIESVFGKKTKPPREITYFQYLAEKLADKLMKWANASKGNNG